MIHSKFFLPPLPTPHRFLLLQLQLLSCTATPFYQFFGSVDAGERHLGGDEAKVGVDAGEGGLVGELLSGVAMSGGDEVVGAEEGEED